MVVLSHLITALALQTPATSAEITIYNQGFGLIKEVRELQLKSGRQSVAISDVASLIDPTSVSFHSLTPGNPFEVLEQNYQFDLINPIAILNKSVGQKIKFFRTVGTAKDVLSGTLLSAPTAVVSNPNGGSEQSYNGMVIRTDDNRIVLNPAGEVQVMSIPPGLISRPTLAWDVFSQSAGNRSVELSYISNGLNWNADYVMTLDGTGNADVQGWVTLSNTSGASWKNAKLKLLAGDIHTVEAPQPTVAFASAFDKAEQLKAPGFKEESLFEYHLYTLQRPADVLNNETKQVTLLEGQGVPVTKKLIVDSIANSYYPSEGEIGTGDIKPQVRIEFQNDEKSKMGMPLPKGKFRIYQRDQSGSVQLLGEDQIDHTPRNEKVSLNVGRSFDVVSTRLRTNFTRLSNQSVRETFTIELRNRKETAETVNVLERHWGDWKVTEHNLDFTKEDSNTMQFIVPLKPNEVKKITYTVETKW